jgi:hypothetical protein
MNRVFVVITLALLLLLSAWSGAEEKADMAILFVGMPDTERTAEFMSFLGEHFREVGFTASETFVPERADPYDVVVFDYMWGFKKVPDLPLDYDRASVLIASGGGLFNKELKLKIDWL